VNHPRTTDPAAANDRTLHARHARKDVIPSPDQPAIVARSGTRQGLDTVKIRDQA
jgi:hypothetical protein